MRLDTLPFLPRAMTSCSASSPLDRVMALRHADGGQTGRGEGLNGASSPLNRVMALRQAGR